MPGPRSPPGDCRPCSCCWSAASCFGRRCSALLPDFSPTARCCGCRCWAVCCARSWQPASAAPSAPCWLMACHSSTRSTWRGTRWAIAPPRPRWTARSRSPAAAADLSAALRDSGAFPPRLPTLLHLGHETAQTRPARPACRRDPRGGVAAGPATTCLVAGAGDHHHHGRRHRRDRRPHCCWQC